MKGARVVSFVVVLNVCLMQLVYSQTLIPSKSAGSPPQQVTLELDSIKVTVAVPRPEEEDKTIVMPYPWDCKGLKCSLEITLKPQVEVPPSFLTSFPKSCKTYRCQTEI